MSKNEKFIVYVKHGKLRAKGNPYSIEHLYLAGRKLELGEVEPFWYQSLGFKLKRAAKLTRKFCKCLKYALTPTTVEARRAPYLLDTGIKKDR